MSVSIILRVFFFHSPHSSWFVYVRAPTIRLLVFVNTFCCCCCCDHACVLKCHLTLAILSNILLLIYPKNLDGLLCDMVRITYAMRAIAHLTHAQHNLTTVYKSLDISIVE